jgi:energy-coupling factor transport system ATP-binding protein
VSTESNHHARPALEVNGLSVRYPRAAVPVLREIDFSVMPGEAVGLSGRSGAGKTSLLHAVAGLVPWLTSASVGGEIAVREEAIQDLDPGQRAHLIATCLDRPDAQLFLATVGQEIEAAKRLYPGGDFTDTLVDGFALGSLQNRRVTELSSGERQRVALTVALAGCPMPVLLDEPTAHLDAAGEAALIELLRQATGRGAAIAISEQAGWRLDSAVTSWFEIDGGCLAPTETPCVPRVPGPDHQPGSDVVLSCRGLSVSRGGRTLAENIDLDLHEGEVIFLSGPNGSGKSTLARVLSGLASSGGGKIRRNGRVALMLPEADLQLFSSTVIGEVSVPGTRQEERARVLRRHRLEHLAARAPWTLSRGEQQRLVHAALDMLRPELMIVDEPAQGLDPDDVLDFLELIRRRSAKGRSYLVISHREELAAAAHRRFVLRNRRLEEVVG